jgi:hypothetical protein
MESDLAQDRQHAHHLLDQLGPSQFAAVAHLLETMVSEEEDDELTEADRVAIQSGLESLEKNGGIPMEDILADFGLTMADFEKMGAASEDPQPAAKRNG